MQIHFTPKFLVFILLIVLLASCQSKKDQKYDHESVSTVKNLTESHKKFIVDFYPGAVEANKHIMLKRAMLIDLRNDYRHVIIKKRKLKDLNAIAKEYRFGADFFNESTSRESYVKQIDTLIYHVDYIPEKLVMTQAIIESGWGRSKFAQEINNYFGIHCYTPGCGRAPTKVENPDFWVKAFPTIEACIEEYLWLLNTGFAYEELRATRAALRDQGKWPDAIALAQGLTRYSEKGSEYIELINTIIKNYLPKDLEAFVDHFKNNTSVPS
jgi:Bax protein